MPAIRTYMCVIHVCVYMNIVCHTSWVHVHHRLIFKIGYAMKVQRMTFDFVCVCVRERERERDGYLHPYMCNVEAHCTLGGHRMFETHKKGTSFPKVYKSP